jgi:hypothetical protein
MVIDQRNAGASMNVATGTYSLDRWLPQISTSGTATNIQSTTAPTGFSNSLLWTVGTAASATASQRAIIESRIEGFNTADLGWGTANAKTVTLSFWVRSSLTGTFCGSVKNSAQNRSYPFTYTINSANTFEYKTVTIAGDTTGTWIGATNGVGLRLVFDLGSGSDFQATAGSWQSGNYNSTSAQTNFINNSGATFYITGVQLEVGTQATSFEYRQYGTELALCQRYLPAYNPSGTSTVIANGYNESTTATRTHFLYQVQPRTNPTGITISAAGDFTVARGGGSAVCTSLTFNSANLQTALLIAGVASGLTAGQGSALRQTSTAGQILFTGCEL